MAAIGESWMTSFFYEQDLKSLYMNGLLNAGFKPGIYNANMYIKATSTGLQLYIKKGTTFVFSSNAKVTTSKTYERDLDNIGTYLIKSYALDDTTIELAKISSDASSSVNYILGAGNTKAPRRFYVVATINYDKEANAGALAKTPQFYCVIANEKFGSTYPSPNDENNYYYSCPLRSTTGSQYFIQDGAMAVSNYEKTCYLIVGVVEYVPESAGAESPAYLTANGSQWAETMMDKWVKTHIFTGRGLPEYRHNLVDNRSQLYPDIMISYEDETAAAAAKIALDAPNLAIEDRVYNEAMDYRTIYRVGPYYKQNFKSIDIPTVTSSSIDVALKNVHEAGEKNPSALVTDLIYATSRSRYSELEVSESYNDPTMKMYTEDEKLELHSYRVYSKCPSTVNWMDPAYNVEGTDNASSTYPAYSSPTSSSVVTIGAPIIPLDVSCVNRDRMLDLVANKNIIPLIINKMRHENIIDPQSTSIIIPVALILRKYVKGASGWNAVDTLSYANRGFNPANILSCFDLQYRTTQINTINIASKDVYSIIPTLE